jgi:excisionase family DNA binding protein
MQSPHQVNVQELLTAQQVQLMLDVDRSTVYRMADDGRLPAIKVGRQWRFPADRIRDVLRLESGPASSDASPVTVLALPTATPPVTAVPELSPDVAAAVARVAADLLGVMMVITDMDGHPVTDVVNPCPWFAERESDPALLETCIEEWRQLADDPDLKPRFNLGPHGFECVRAFVRRGPVLVGMVLAGGIAPTGSTGTGFYELDGDGRRRVLSAVPKVAAALSQVPSRPVRTGEERSAR